MKKATRTLYAQTIANLKKLHELARHAESRQALGEASISVEVAIIRELPITHEREEHEHD